MSVLGRFTGPVKGNPRSVGQQHEVVVATNSGGIQLSDHAREKYYLLGLDHADRIALAAELLGTVPALALVEALAVKPSELFPLLRKIRVAGEQYKDL